MARLVVCDACGSTTPEDDAKEFTIVKLHKLVSPTVAFQVDEICESCTAQVRRILQGTPS